MIYSDNEKKEFKMRGYTDDMMFEIAEVLRAFRKATSNDYGFEVSDLLVQWIVEAAYTTNDKDMVLVNEKMRAKLEIMLGGNEIDLC